MTLREEQLFKVAFGDVEGTGHGLKLHEYIRTNALSIEGLQAAYEAGVSLLSCDIRQGEITAEDFERIGQLYTITPADTEGNGWDFEYYDFPASLWPADYFHLWRIITLIGDRGLRMDIVDHDAEIVELSGAAVAESFQNQGEASIYFQSVGGMPTQNEDSVAERKQSAYEQEVHSNLYRCHWGEFYSSILKDYWVFVRSNARSRDEIDEAYRLGATAISFDIEHFMTFSPESPPHSINTISMDAFESIKQRAQVVDLKPDLNLTPDVFEVINGRVKVTPGQYFLLWRATARIGNPALHLDVVSDDTPMINIGGYNVFKEL
jgi:hypothetical protein